MKAHLVRRGDADARRIAGMVLCHDLRAGEGARALERGTILSAADAAAALDLPWDELHLIEMEAGDVHEDAAGSGLARLVAGDGAVAGAPAAGHWPVCAARRGLLAVDAAALRAANAVEGVCVYTLFDGQVVDAGEVVARAKIAPFVLDAARARELAAAAERVRGCVRVRPFLPTRVGAVVQETLGAGAMSRFRDALGEKVAWLGGALLEPAFVPPSADAIAVALERLLSSGARLLTVAGTKSMDPLDPVFRALDALGVRLERHGVPAHPGSLFWLARLRGVPILGMPSCGLFSRATVFDLVLPRILAGEAFGAAEMAEMGHGGFLTRDMAFRFPPYRAARSRGEVE
jgi:hypothetical protein